MTPRTATTLFRSGHLQISLHIYIYIFHDLGQGSLQVRTYPSNNTQDINQVRWLYHTQPQEAITCTSDLTQAPAVLDCQFPATTHSTKQVIGSDLSKTPLHSPQDSIGVLSVGRMWALLNTAHLSNPSQACTHTQS